MVRDKAPRDWRTVSGTRNSRYYVQNNKECQPLFKIQGLDGNGNMFTRANALLWNESEEAFLFVYKSALPVLWGDSVCAATSTMITHR